MRFEATWHRDSHLLTWSLGVFFCKVRTTVTVRTTALKVLPVRSLANAGVYGTPFPMSTCRLALETMPSFSRSVGSPSPFVLSSTWFQPSSSHWPQIKIFESILPLTDCFQSITYHILGAFFLLGASIFSLTSFIQTIITSWVNLIWEHNWSLCF